MAVKPAFSVVITGVRPTITQIGVEAAGAQVRATAAIYKIARDIQAKARANMRTHHYDGRAERATEVWASVKSPMFTSFKVGIKGTSFAPEGKTFEVGWRSLKGLQPPVEAIEPWVRRKGLASSEREVNRIAFTIARKMGQRGYSFNEFHWLSDAAGDSLITAPVVVAKYIAAAWAGQPRVPAGEPGGGRFLPG